MRSETAALNATAVGIRTGACLIRGIEVEQRNQSAPELYVQVFNTNTPTVGSTAPVMVLPVPAGDANQDVMSLDYNISGLMGGKKNLTGLAVACTTTPSGSTNPTSGQEPRVVVDWNQLGP